MTKTRLAGGQHMNQGEALHMIASVSQIESRMFLIREQKVMLSQHLSELHEVEPANLKSQFVTSNRG